MASFGRRSEGVPEAVLNGSGVLVVTSFPSAVASSSVRACCDFGGFLFAGASAAGEPCAYFEAILIDFVGDALALPTCFSGSGVATFRSGVPKWGLGGAARFGVSVPASREGVLNSVRAGVCLLEALPVEG